MDQPIGRRPLMAGAAALGFLLPTPGARTAGIEPPCGPVRGVAAGGVTAFLGLPYAVSPIGPLRYASPRPAPRWTAPRDAAAAGAAAIQTLGGGAAWLYEPVPRQSEDCLFLNVWTPDPAGRRPVMVWLHGGAWRAGRGEAAGTVGATLARTGEVVVVTVNYRLGALGWLAHPALADPDTGAFANWGLQDQVLALRWVQANIAAFGGDPDNVTLFGQSAGGSSTASIAQDARHAGLLHKAIIESGSLHGAPGFPEVATAAAYAEALARHATAGHPAFLYEFVRPLAPPAHGVPHTAEIPFVFGTFADPFFAAKVGDGPGAADLSRFMLQAWASFARSGVPGAAWARVAGPSLAVNVLGGPSGLHAVDPSLREQELAVWNADGGSRL